MRDFCDTASSYQDLLKDDASELCPATMPLEIKLKGLDMKRQWYLYQSIREYVLTEKQDLVCPLPEVSVSDNADSDSDSELDVSTPPRKCARTLLGRGRGRGRGSEGKD